MEPKRVSSGLLTFSDDELVSLLFALDYTRQRAVLGPRDQESLASLSLLLQQATNR